MSRTPASATPPTTAIRRRRLALAVAVAGLLVASCSSEDPLPDDAVDGATSSSTASSSTASSSTASSISEDAAYFGPVAGSELSVIAVAYDDFMTVRAEPPADSVVVTTFPEAPGGPTSAAQDERALVAVGEAAVSDGETWYNVTVDGTEGWAPAGNLAVLGETSDVTAEVEPIISSPRGVDLEDLAAAAIGARGYGNDIEVTYVTEPLYFEGVGAFAFIDLTGFADDSVIGERLRVAATLDYGDTVDDDEPVVEYVFLDTVEATPICARGVADGACI